MKHCDFGKYFRALGLTTKAARMDFCFLLCLVRLLGRYFRIANALKINICYDFRKNNYIVHKNTQRGFCFSWLVA